MQIILLLLQLHSSWIINETKFSGMLRAPDYCPTYPILPATPLIHTCVRACMCMWMQVCLLSAFNRVWVHAEYFWPSQTGAPGRCPWCPGHGSLPPGESMRSTQCSVLEVLLDPSTHPWRVDNIITRIINSSCVCRGEVETLNSPVCASTSKNSLKKAVYNILMITINGVMKWKLMKRNGWI